MSEKENSKVNLVAEVEDLRKSEELHRVIISNISDAILVTNDEGDFTYVSPSSDIIFGYSAAEVLALGNVAKLLGPPLFDPIDLEKSGEIRNIERRARTKSGETRCLLITVKRVSIHGGTVLYNCRDITERKTIEDMLHNQLDFLEVFMDAIPGPIFYKNTDHIYLGCNQAFAEFIGLPKEDIVGKSVYEVARKELADLYKRKDEDLFQNPGIQIFEAPVKQSDGSKRYVMFHKATYIGNDGKVAGLLGFGLDITRRKLAEEALQES